MALAAALPPASYTSTAAAASDAVQTTDWVPLHAGSRMRLVAVGGPTVHAGVELQLADDWKTYWRMPGEAGVPPQFEWQGSSNVKSVKVLYPAPHRLIEPAAQTVGYKHSVLFPVEAVAQDANRPVGLKVDMEFGLCKDICVPVQASLALTLAPAGRPAALPAMLKDALAQVPRSSAERRAGDPEIVRTQAQLDGAAPKLTIDVRFAGEAKGADLFVEAPDSIFVPLPKPASTSPDGTLRFEIPLSASTAKDLRGKPLTLTAVSDAGASEAQWKLP